MAAATAIISLASGIISNKQKQTENATTALNTLSKEYDTAEKSLKTWKTVFVGSLVVAVILIVVLLFTGHKRR